jgi:hypothetical protein
MSYAVNWGFSDAIGDDPGDADACEERVVVASLYTEILGTLTKHWIIRIVSDFDINSRRLVVVILPSL